MFTLVENFKKRKIIGTLSLEAFVEGTRDGIFNDVTEARTLDRKSKEYELLKKSAQSVAFNFSYEKNYVNGSNATKSTGYLFLDTDNQEDLDLSEFPFVVSYWKSFSGKGYGILVSVSGIDKTNLKYAAEQISSVLGIDYDKNAVSPDRFCVLSYDPSIYFNPSHATYTYTHTHTHVHTRNVLHNSVQSITLENRVSILHLNETIQNRKYSVPLRFSTVAEVSENIDFNGRAFKTFKDDKKQIARVVIPNKIKVGSRNTVISTIGIQFKALNPEINLVDIYQFLTKVNQEKCEEPLDCNDIYSIAASISKSNPEINMNETKTVVFDPRAGLSCNQKKSIGAKEGNRLRGRRTYQKIEDCIYNWDVQKNGNITSEKVRDLTGVSLSTVKRYYPDFKNYVKSVNNAWKSQSKELNLSENNKDMQKEAWDHIQGFARKRREDEAAFNLACFHELAQQLGFILLDTSRQKNMTDFLHFGGQYTFNKITGIIRDKKTREEFTVTSYPNRNYWERRFIMPFGKHKGKEMGDVAKYDFAYLMFIESLDNLQPEFRQELEEYFIQSGVKE